MLWVKALEEKLGKHKVITAPDQLGALATDASYFRITPKAIVDIETPEDVTQLLAVCSQNNIGVTFRAAGTSLSGQAIGSGVLARVRGGYFKKCRVIDDGQLIELGPAVTGGQANHLLESYGRKIGPDPATVNIANIGGIIANNSSGMCCGTTDNAYQTIQSATLIFADGTSLDTSSKASCDSFAITHAAMLEGLIALRQTILSDSRIEQRIRHKYRLKNTTGYGVNALLDFNDPIDQLLHLAVGSEGTLCFIESVVLESVKLKSYRAASLLCFSDVFTAADAVPVLKALNVSAVELLDWTSLRTMIGKSGTPEWLSELKSGNAALLVEVSADTPEMLQSLYAPIIAAQFRGLVRPVVFEKDTEQITALWQIRSGIFPVVGSKRPKGSMVIIEDVAVPVDQLGSFVNELRGLFERYEFHSAVIFGHARDGNLHFIVTPNLSIPSERDRFKQMMESLVALVVDRFDGSLKAEHGTGRAMAPFVAREWGDEIYGLMTRIKALFDPHGILNPDVIINSNTEAHIQQLKELPSCNDEMDLCIECGFCEPACPTSPFNYSPRQRIAAHRLSQLGERVDLEAVASSCVACGHCEQACPVGINTSRALNANETAARSRMSRHVLSWQLKHWGAYLELSRRAIAMYRLVSRYGAGQRWLAWLHRQFPKRVPKWIPAKIEHPGVSSLDSTQYLLLTNCADRILNDSSLASTIQRLALSVDVRVAVLGEHFCCGQRFDHLGETEFAKRQREQFDSLADDAVVIAEASSCLSTLLNANTQRVIGFAQFVTAHILPKLTITRISERAEVHLGCTLKSAAERQHLTALLDQLLDDWSFTDLACCGGQGEVQFFDETASANLITSSDLAKNSSIVIGMNTSCESALARQLRRPVMSLAALLEQCASDSRVN